jgi:hypothetical protein
MTTNQYNEEQVVFCRATSGFFVMYLDGKVSGRISASSTASDIQAALAVRCRCRWRWRVCVCVRERLRSSNVQQRVAVSCCRAAYCWQGVGDVPQRWRRHDRV